MKGIQRIANFKERSFDNLYTYLRQALDNRFSDDLIEAIVLAFFDNETLRLGASEYKVQAITPLNKEYTETIRELNSHMILLSRWINSTPSEFDRKVGKLITDYEEDLDSIITKVTPFYLFNGVHEDKHGNPVKVEGIFNFHDPRGEVHIRVTSKSGQTENFHEPWPSKHIFYYTSLLVLLKAHKNDQGKKELMFDGLIMPQLVAFYCLLNPALAQIKGEEQKTLSDFLSTNKIFLDTTSRQSFERAIRRYRSEKKWTIKKLLHRIELLSSLEAYISEKHPGHIVSLKKEIKFLKDEIIDLE